MICIIAGNYNEAVTWARAQELSKDEWFYPTDETDLKSRMNFHVIVTPGAYYLPSHYFERMWSLARQRGRMNGTN